MKRLLLSAAAAALITSAAGQAVIDNGTELIVPGLYDSGTTLDTAIVDKQTGQIRTGTNSGTALTWAAPLLSGLSGISEATSGRVGLPLNEGLILISRNGNRLARVSPLDGSSPPVLYPRVAPTAAVALDYAGSSPASNTNGLWLASADAAPSVTPEVINLVTPSSTSLSATAGAQGFSSRLECGQRVRVTAAGNWLGAFCAPAEGKFYLLQATATGLPATPWRPTSIGVIAGIPAGARFSHEYWLPGGQAMLLFHGAGDSRIYHLPAATGNLNLTTFLDTGMSTGFFVSLNSGGVQGLIAFPQSAAPAHYFVWNGTGFQLQQTIPPPANGRWTGAIPGAGLMLLHGPATGGGTSGWQYWPMQGNGQFAFSGGGTVPARTMAMPAHVFAFNQEPFVSAAAAMTDARRVTDWTSGALALPGTRVMNVSRESYGGTTAGLGAPTAFNAGTAPAGSAWMLTNQYAPDISVSALSPDTIQLVIPTVQISPPPRHLHVAALTTPVSDTITFNLSAGATVYYRTSPGQPFKVYQAATPPVISVTALPQTTVVEYYAAAGAAQTRLYLAAYSYGTAPNPAAAASLDSDSNGLADAWERYYGITDPNGDPDGDGLNNLTEQNSGSDPLGPCRPAEMPDLTLAPQDGTLRIQLTRALVPGENLESSPDLTSWDAIPLAPGQTSIAIPGKQFRRFYRITRP